MSFEKLQPITRINPATERVWVKVARQRNGPNRLYVYLNKHVLTKLGWEEGARWNEGVLLDVFVGEGQDKGRIKVQPDGDGDYVTAKFNQPTQRRITLPLLPGMEDVEREKVKVKFVIDCGSLLLELPREWPTKKVQEKTATDLEGEPMSVPLKDQASESVDGIHVIKNGYDFDPKTRTNMYEDDPRAVAECKIGGRNLPW